MKYMTLMPLFERFTLFQVMVLPEVAGKDFPANLTAGND
jgi:hypothetical protein